MVSLIVSPDVVCQASVIDQRPDKLQERLVFGTVGSIPEEFTYGRVGYLSARAKVGLMFHDGHIGGRVADQRPGIAVAAFVQSSLSHVELIGLAVLGSSARPPGVVDPDASGSGMSCAQVLLRASDS